MKTNSHSEDLKMSIELLNNRKHQEWQAIKDEINDFKDHLKPLNLIKSAVEEVKDNLGDKNDIIKTAFSLGLGFLTSKIIVGKSDSKIKKFISSLVLMGVTKFIDKTPILNR